MLVYNGAYETQAPYQITTFLPQPHLKYDDDERFYNLKRKRCICDELEEGRVGNGTVVVYKPKRR